MKETSFLKAWINNVNVLNQNHFYYHIQNATNVIKVNITISKIKNVYHATKQNFSTLKQENANAPIKKVTFGIIKLVSHVSIQNISTSILWNVNSVRKVKFITSIIKNVVFVLRKIHILMDNIVTLAQLIHNGMKRV